MKKYTLVVISVVLGLLVAGLLTFNLFSPETKITSALANMTYVYGGQEIREVLSPEESQLLRSIFDSRRPYSDNPSCGFTEDISISFGSLVFCIACDDCPIIKFGNKYFKISEEDRETINQIFEKYGGTFPCL